MYRIRIVEIVNNDRSTRLVYCSLQKKLHEDIFNLFSQKLFITLMFNKFIFFSSFVKIKYTAATIRLE